MVRKQNMSLKKYVRNIQLVKRLKIIFKNRPIYKYFLKSVIIYFRAIGKFPLCYLFLFKLCTPLDIIIFLQTLKVFLCADLPERCPIIRSHGHSACAGMFSSKSHHPGSKSGKIKYRGGNIDRGSS